LAQKKYQSAYDALEKADPKNQYPDLALKKIKIALEDGIYNPDEKNFSFKDLSSGQSLSKVRQEKAEGPFYNLRPEEVLNDLIKKHPGDWRFYQPLAQYYVWLAMNNGDYSSNESQAYLKLAQEKYMVAFNHQVLDAEGQYGLGLVHFYQQDFMEAVTCFNQAVEKGDQTPDAYYMLAYTQSYTGQHIQSIPNAQKAFELYTDPTCKETAAQLVAMDYEAMKDDRNAEKFLVSASQTLPGSRTISSAIFDLDLKIGDMKNAGALAEEFLLQNPTDLNNLHNLTHLYNSAKRTKDFYLFLKRMKRQYAKKNEILASLYLCEGLSELTEHKKKEAKAAFKKSAVIAKKVTPSNEVFLKYVQSLSGKNKK
jgi:predicted Zn-dependent protease